MIDQLRKMYQEGRIIPFLGSGISSSVTWMQDGTTISGPSWDDLVKYAAGQLGFSDPDLLLCRGTSLQILEYFRLKHGNIAPLSNWLYGRLTPPDDAIKKSSIHSALANLTKCKVFYTTNYENYLETALKLAGRSCNVVVEERHMGRSATDCEVVKFHGDFNHPERMVVSESHYEDRLAFSTPIDLRLRSDMLGRVILFVGYSFRDPNVSYLFHLVRRHLPDPVATGMKRAYIVFPEPSEFERELFSARQIGVIPISRRDMRNGTTEILSGLVD